MATDALPAPTGGGIIAAAPASSVDGAGQAINSSIDRETITVGAHPSPPQEQEQARAARARQAQAPAAAAPIADDGIAPANKNNDDRAAKADAPAGAAAPFHVLLLAGGNRLPENKLEKYEEGNNTNTNKRRSSSSSVHHYYEQRVLRYDNADDYLFRRKEFRTKKRTATSTQQPRAAAKDDESSSAGAGEDYNAPPPSLRILASPLEIAMGGCCCEPLASSAHYAAAADGGQSSDGEAWYPKSSASGQHRVRHHRLHRPVAPANCADEDNILPANVVDSPASSPPRKRAGAGASGNGEAGILQSGREGRFLTLLLMYCPKHALGHRALAVAILQRTADWEASSETASRRFDGIDDRRNIIRARRIGSFLAAGGMKLLAGWLTDAYTAVPTPSSSLRRLDKHRLGSQHAASPTGCLLLPLLRLLKSIPFDKTIVLEAQIHKSIKRLKKALARLGDDALGNRVHPIAGGLPVGKVIAAVESVMTSWSKAAEAKDALSDDDRSKLDPFREQRAAIQMRFNDLAKFYNGEGDPPEWLPKSILGMRRAVPAVKPTKQPPPPLHATQQNAKDSTNNGQWATVQKPPAPKMQNAGAIQGLMSRKRPSAALFIEPPKMGHRQKQRKVSWADRPKNRLIPPRPLREERIFTKDEDVWQEDSLIPDEMRFEDNNGGGNLDEIAARAAEALNDLPPAGGIKVEGINHEAENAAREEIVEEPVVAGEGIKAEYNQGYEEDSDMEDLF